MSIDTANLNGNPIASADLRVEETQSHGAYADAVRPAQPDLLGRGIAPDHPAGATAAGTAARTVDPGETRIDADPWNDAPSGARLLLHGGAANVVMAPVDVSDLSILDAVSSAVDFVFADGG